jgi:membrane-associated protease RseP (regulator of RpoE activity)
MSQNPEMPLPVTSAPSVTTCLNCHSAMPAELRFCRNCGFRLGEGVAEYNETIRFDGSNIPMGPAVASVPRKRRRKISGMTWIFVGLLAFFVCAAAFTAIVTPFRPNVQFSAPAPPRSFAGVNEFETAEGSVGVTFDNIDTPGGPADKAGLVGGDIITTFDGRPVTEDDQMMDLLRQTPIGKTVEVVFIRDGEVKTTKLTTIAKEEMDRLWREFRSRPEGTGRFGYDDGDSERVQIPGTQLYGVKLNDIHPSLPADMAGVKAGDIVTEFDGIPIRTPRELRQRVLFAMPYKTIKLVVFRDGQKVEIPVKMGKQ